MPFARIGFLNMLAYRARYYVGVATYLFNVAVYYFIWRAVFRQSAAVVGLSLPEMITYVAVGWTIRSFYFNEIDRDIAAQVQEGRLAMNLIRPVDFQTVMIADSAGQSAFRAVLFTVPIGIVVGLVFPVRPPASLPAAALFLVSAGLSFFLVAAINFLVGLVAIRTKSILGILRAKYLILELLSGSPDPDHAFSPAVPDDPLRLPVSSHQLHAGGSLPGKAHRLGPRRGCSPCRPHGRWPPRRGTTGLATVASAHHDPGRLKRFWIFDFGFSIGLPEHDPQSPAASAVVLDVLRAVREGAARVPGGFLLVGAGFVPGDGGVVRVSADRVLQGPGGEGVDLRGDGFPLRVFAHPARHLQRLLLEPVPLRRPVPDRGTLRQSPAPAGLLHLPGPVRVVSPGVDAGDGHRPLRDRLGVAAAGALVRTPRRDSLRRVGSLRRRRLPGHLHRPDRDLLLDRGPDRDLAARLQPDAVRPLSAHHL